jgi:cytochrome c oxidase subunit 2
MLSKVVVHEPADFAKWLEVASDLAKQPGFTPVKAGGQIIKAMGCTNCHSVDGTANTGPSFKDVFGKQELLSDGSTVLVDENYVRDSILYPQKTIVKGFGPVMPSFLGRLKDHEIDWIIWYLKSISANYKGDMSAGLSGNSTAVATTQQAAPATKPAQ